MTEHVRRHSCQDMAPVDIIIKTTKSLANRNSRIFYIFNPTCLFACLPTPHYKTLVDKCTISPFKLGAVKACAQRMSMRMHVHSHQWCSESLNLFFSVANCRIVSAAAVATPRSCSYHSAAVAQKLSQQRSWEFAYSSLNQQFPPCPLSTDCLPLPQALFKAKTQELYPKQSSSPWWHSWHALIAHQHSGGSAARKAQGKNPPCHCKGSWVKSKSAGCLCCLCVLTVPPSRW